MINKDSLLDAYMTLGGSPLIHLAMLLVAVFVLHQPDEIEGDDRDDLQNIYYYSIIIHSASFLVLGIIDIFDAKVTTLKVIQVLETIIVFANIFLLLRSVKLYAEL